MLQSDLSLELAKVRTPADEVTAKTNAHLLHVQQSIPRWYEVGAQKFREMRNNGETPLPMPVKLDGENVQLPSRDAGRSIPCRIIKPDNGAEVKGVYMHIHGGGWVLGDEKSYDGLLKSYANGANLLCISVGYRLAPEHPFPAGPEDCYDAADWLADNSQKEYGVPLQFIGGESAGGHLTALSALHLLESRPSHSLKGLVFNYGAFNLGPQFPTNKYFDMNLVLNPEIMAAFTEAFLPKTTPLDRCRPDISPFFANLEGKKLAPALFACGTYDPLLDDTVMMALKWQMAGAETIVKLFPGAPHGFSTFAPNLIPAAKESMDITIEFLKTKMTA